MKMNFVSKFSSAAVLALGLSLAGTAAAQVSTSVLAGKAPAGDTVIARNVETGVEHEVQADEKGRFQLRRIPVGVYEVIIRHADGTADKPILARARLGSTVKVN